MSEIGIGRTGGTTVIAIEGDVTRQPVEAVVNPANAVLQHNEGIPTSMVRTGGRVIQEESDEWVLDNGPLDPGQAAVTTGGMLQASHVVHVVGPIYGETDNPDAVLTAAVEAALAAVRDHGLRSVAFPAISSGKRSVHAPTVTRVIVNAVADWLEANPDTITDVTLVGSRRKEARLFSLALEERLRG
jgi:O-acetyl-ADP-ribose deacetylase (regulator of RNase III)